MGTEMDKCFFERVERARTDVAEHDADRTDDQAPFAGLDVTALTGRRRVRMGRGDRFVVGGLGV